ncbi:MAG: UbiD family decarboxylase [Candidatus Tectomicrobia bacterium]|nr:UbiD family decarboxylase [Candidatus Tectomicrobia bacterium]
MSGLGELDTGFRSSIRRLHAADRLMRVWTPVDPRLELSAFVKGLDGDLAFFFERVKGWEIPVCCNLLASQKNALVALGVDLKGLRAAVQRAIDHPIPPAEVEKGPCQEVTVTDGIDLGAMFPVPFHMPGDAGRFMTGSIVIAKDTESGVRNASFHRLQLLGGNRTALKLDLGRHLRDLYERAEAEGRGLEIAVVLGPDLSLFFAAASMGAHLPRDRDELAWASGLKGRPLELVKCLTVDLEVSADAEIVLEGVLLPQERVPEGPFLEFVGLYAEQGPSPVFEVRAVTHRRDPIYYDISGGEVRLIRKPLMEPGILRMVRAAVPVVQDVCLTAGGLCRFHLVIQVKKERPADEGLQRNAAFAALAALKDIDLITLVDEDVDPHDPQAVEWAVATRFDAGRDLMLLPGARGHEYVPVSRGVRTKMVMDATVPPGELDRYRRVPMPGCDFSAYETHVGKSAPVPASHPIFEDAP